MLSKDIVHNEALATISSRLSAIQVEFDALNEALSSETKSSAGDKHETGRAMAQLEQEKLSRQLLETKRLRDGLVQINPKERTTKIGFGSLVETNRGYFFVSFGIGTLHVKKAAVICISAGSPIGQQLLHKQAGDRIQLNGEIKILSVQ
jgi:transcription elongation GreA/GreB family factor